MSNSYKNSGIDMKKGYKEKLDEGYSYNDTQQVSFD